MAQIQYLAWEFSYAVGGTVKLKTNNKKRVFLGLPLWLSGLRIWSCHCSSSDCCCATGSIPGGGTSEYNGCVKKKKKEYFSGLSMLTCWATPDPNLICDVHCSLGQHWILNSLNEARDWTCVLMDTSWVHYCWATIETPSNVRKIIQPNNLTFKIHVQCLWLNTNKISYK